MFASCYDLESGRRADYLDEDAPPNVYSVLANVRALGYTKNSNLGKRLSNDRVLYVPTPLLGALGDVMLAMLIKVCFLGQQSNSKADENLFNLFLSLA